MKRLKDLTATFTVIGILIALFNADTASAIDGVVQAESFIKNIVKTLVGISGGVSVVFIVIGGFHYITSSGHPERLDKAKRTLLYSGVGLVIVLAAYAIVDFVAEIAKSSFGS